MSVLRPQSPQCLQRPRLSSYVPFVHCRFRLFGHLRPSKHSRYIFKVYGQPNRNPDIKRLMPGGFYGPKFHRKCY
jgi:hypothetical protein